MTALLLCNHPGCYFELPADCFPFDTRNIRRDGRSTRCYDCESARTRKPGAAPRPDSQAARVAAVKASGEFKQHNAETWKADRGAGAHGRHLEAQRTRDRAKAAAGFPKRLEQWTFRAREGVLEFGSPAHYAMQKLEEVCSQMGAEVPEDLRPFVGSWRPRAEQRLAVRERRRVRRDRAEALRQRRVLALQPTLLPRMEEGHAK